MPCSALVLFASVFAAAQPAPRPYDAAHYRIELRLKEGGEFASTVRVTLKPKKAVREVELDSVGLSIRSALVNGEQATFALKGKLDAGVLTVKCPKPLAAGKEATIEVAYTGKAGLPQQGLFTVSDPNRPDGLPYYFTHLETSSARRLFPCNDRPDDKATTELLAVVDGRYQVLSNGRKEKDEAFAEGSENLRRVHWRQEQPHPTYAVAIAIGEFDEVAVPGDVPATLHVLKGTADRAFVASDVTRFALGFQAQFLGVKYPWAKYDQVAVPHFTWGGMENTSLVLMRDNGLVLETRNYILGRSRITGLVAHELAHQWFGDYVTCKSWNDVWLNEGFATYLGAATEAAYYENDYVDVDRALDTVSGYFRAEDGPRAHALLPTGASAAQDIFDSVSYTKGANVLRMLEHTLGKQEFQRGLKAYLEKYALGNATSEDFFATLAKGSKKDKELRAFRDAWLRKRGYPVLYPELRYSAGTAIMALRQKPNRVDEKGPFAFPITVVFHREASPAFHEELVLWMDKPEITAKVELPAAPQWVNWNKGGVALARVNGASVSEDAWVIAARAEPDPVWRLYAQLALLGELVSAAPTEQAMPSITAMDAVREALASDPSPYVRWAVLTRLSATKWKRLPAELGPVVLSLAKRPERLAEDALGRIKVRAAAMRLLGKLAYPEGHDYLLAELARKEIDLNFLAAIAGGTARIGTTLAVASLRAAVDARRPYGYAQFRAAAAELGAAETPEVMPAITELVRGAAGDSELVRSVFTRIGDNEPLKHSPELANFVSDFVLAGADFSDDLKSDALELLDEVKGPAAKEALASVAERSESERLRQSAKQVLEANFPRR